MKFWNIFETNSYIEAVFWRFWNSLPLSIEKIVNEKYQAAQIPKI